MPGGNKGRNTFKDLRHINIGLEFLVSTLIGVGIGYWLDLYFKTSPWLLLLGLLIGTASGFVRVYRFISELEEVQKNKDKNKKE